MVVAAADAVAMAAVDVVATEISPSYAESEGQAISVACPFFVRIHLRRAPVYARRMSSGHRNANVKSGNMRPDILTGTILEKTQHVP